MIKHRKQDRIFLAFAFLLLMSPDVSAQGPEMTPHQKMVMRAQGAAGAGGDETLPIDSLIGGIKETFSDLGALDLTGMFESDPPEEQAGDAALPLKKDKAKPDREPAQKKTGAEAPDPDPEAAQAPPEDKPKPYKVYKAPMILGPSSAPAPASEAFSSWTEQKVPMVDPSEPPPLTNPSFVKSSSKPARAKTAKPSSGVPPVASLPKQFFPLLPLGGGDQASVQFLPLASNVPLEADHGHVRRALIVIHDISRDSADSIATLMTLSGVDGEQTLILAPQFPLSVDLIRFAKHLPDAGAHIARWELELGWQFGGDSRLPQGKSGISSFTAVDFLLMYLADRNRFPSLEKIVLVGHGMGADFVQRYAAASAAPDIAMQERISVHFLVANASSYLYLTGIRPADGGSRFAHPDPESCPHVNAYPYGLDSLSFYARRSGANAIRLSYPHRSMTYLVGDKILVDHYLDQDCAAQAQGKDRPERGRNFATYIQRSFGDMTTSTQRFVVIPNAGYDPVALFGSYCGMSVLFGNGECL